MGPRTCNLKGLAAVDFQGRGRFFSLVNGEIGLGSGIFGRNCSEAVFHSARQGIGVCPGHGLGGDAPVIDDTNQRHPVDRFSPGR